MPRNDYRYRRTLNELELRRRLDLVETIARRTSEWHAAEKQRSEARRFFPIAASLYADCLLKYGPASSLARDAHRAMLANHQRAQEGDVPGVGENEQPELIGVFVALECGADSERAACTLARAAQEFDKPGKKLERRERARSILLNPQCGALIKTAQRERVRHRWIAANQLRLAVINGFIERGEWNADDPEVALVRERYTRLLALHTTPTNSAA